MADKDTESSSPHAEDVAVEPQFETLCVLEFNGNASRTTIEWLLAKIQASKMNGGGELQVRTVLNKQEQECILHIGARKHRLLLAAELMELKKTYRDGLQREVSVADLDNFKDQDNLLTMADKQCIVLHELESIRASRMDENIPGCPKVKLYHGEAIIPKCVNEKVITNLFPLHDHAELKKLGKDWYQTLLKPVPIAEIHKYFGDTVCMYFAFLSFYTMSLIPPGLIGIIGAFSAWENVSQHVFFCIFNLVWVTIFLEAWKRTQATLAYQWGTIDSEPFEEARASYYGIVAEDLKNPITKRMEPKYPKWKRVLKFYGVTVPFVLACLYLAFLAMLFYFWMQEKADKYHKERQSYWSLSVSLALPSAIYAILISIMNAIYRKAAKALNDWENHRLQSAYNNHLITKLVLFNSVNCFLSLFYVAFYMQDLVLLKSHLAAMLITQQIIGQIQETLVPYLQLRHRKKQIKAKQSQEADVEEIEPLVGGSGMEHVEDRAKRQGEIESSMEVYDGILDDYLEMFLQFGYVFLFSAAFPSAAFWALLNNITEIRTDAFKMCRVFQRPFAQPTSGIGAWQVAFEMMGVMAVVTNTALLALQPAVQDYIPFKDSTQVLLCFVVAEHVLLLVKVGLAFLIPDKPRWVDIAQKKLDYEAKQAWRKQRNSESRKHLDTWKTGSQLTDDKKLKEN